MAEERSIVSILSSSDHPAHALFLIAPFTSIRNLLTTYKIGGLLPIFWPLGLWKVLSDLADRHLHTRFESDKTLYQLITLSIGRRQSDEELKGAFLDYTLSEEDLRHELGLTDTSISRLEVETKILISHADDDGVIPHAHGRSLFDTVAEALDQKKLAEKEYGWGLTYTVKSESGTSHTLIKSKKGGHNGVPAHAIELFGNLNGLENVKSR